MDSEDHELDMDSAFVTALDLTQEYLYHREKLDDLLREGFLNIAKAKCTKSSLPGVWNSVPARARASRRISVQDYEPGHCNTSVEDPQSSDGSTCTTSVKEFIQSLASKYDCCIDDNVHDSTCMRRDEERKLSEPWNNCRNSFCKVLDEIGEIVQIVYKLHVAMHEQRQRAEDIRNK